MERFGHSEMFFEGTKSTGLSELLIGYEEEDSLVFVLNNDGWWSPTLKSRFGG